MPRRRPRGRVWAAPPRPVVRWLALAALYLVAALLNVLLAVRAGEFWPVALAVVLAVAAAGCVAASVRDRRR